MLAVATAWASQRVSGPLEPSHVMRAMGIPYTAAHGTIRFSLSPYWSGEGPVKNPEEAFAPSYA
ncbi:MAG: hypothetical protein WC540_04340 [Sulfuritalea sp.]